MYIIYYDNHNVKIHFLYILPNLLYLCNFMFSLMSDFLKGSSEDDESETSEVTIEPKLLTQKEAEANSPSSKKAKAKTEEIQEYVDIINTLEHDVAALNRYLLEKQNEGWKQRFPPVSHSNTMLIFSWFKISPIN